MPTPFIVIDIINEIIETGKFFLIKYNPNKRKKAHVRSPDIVYPWYENILLENRTDTLIYGANRFFDSSILNKYTNGNVIMVKINGSVLGLLFISSDIQYIISLVMTRSLKKSHLSSFGMIRPFA